MASRFRKSPPVCLGISIGRLIFGKLQLPNRYIGQKVNMEEDLVYTIFRHITKKNSTINSQPVVFIVSFKFARLSHKANTYASIMPMLLITGFPGFITKIYAVNFDNGYWQGMYQWTSKEALEEYKKSFVFKMMNKRAIDETVHSMDLDKESLINFIEKNKVS
jgi:hypothetical protein